MNDEHEIENVKKVADNVLDNCGYWLVSVRIIGLGIFIVSYLTFAAKIFLHKRQPLRK